jgi:SPP1 family predicted phage head-tail adaptor
MACRFNPGDYRHRITFLKHATGQDDYGDPVDMWVPFKSAWASKEPILGNEFFAAMSAGTKVEVKFNCRYFPGVTNAMRIQHGEEIYEILSAIDVKSLHQELLCYCRLVEQ